MLPGPGSVLLLAIGAAADPLDRTVEWQASFHTTLGNCYGNA